MSMDEMSSAEFRKRYATLTRTTLVTVNGHAIGTWTPGRVDTLRWDNTADAPSRADAEPVFASRPFTPVPKPSKRR